MSIPTMKIKNVEKSSLVDYPPHISCVVFLSGCNFRCGFCYNKSLVVEDDSLPDIPKEDFLKWLEERIGKNDSVVLTGGEPTLHAELPEFCREIKQMGFKVKIDTNGTNPLMLKLLIDEKLVDFISMDIKADRMRYPQASGVGYDWMDNVEKSKNLIISSTTPHEFRTTLIPGIHDETVIKTICLWLKGAQKYSLQQFKPLNTLDPEYEKLIPIPDGEIEKMKQTMEQLKSVIEMEFKR
jgi:pyruvate formate lyase activating enzyme